MNGKDFLEARGQLLALRDDRERAAAEFRWPVVERFNWALDWFDAVLAQGERSNHTALHIVGDHAARLMFAQLSERSNRVANGLRSLGVKRGDRILLI